MRRGPDYWEPMNPPWTAWRATYEPTAQLTHALYRRDLPNGASDYARFTLRWVYRHEMQHLLERTGFEIEAVYGAFDGMPLDEQSTEQIWLARRPDGL